MAFTVSFDSRSVAAIGSNGPTYGIGVALTVVALFALTAVGTDSRAWTPPGSGLSGSSSHPMAIPAAGTLVQRATLDAPIVANRGQADPRLRYLVSGRVASIGFVADGPLISFGAG